MKKLFSSIVAIDNDGIPYNIPDTRYKKWKINSLGFREKEFDLEKKKGRIRIMCFGSSETLGVHETEGKEWPSQLGELLKDKYPEIEIINISIMGLSQKMRKAYIEKYVLPLAPDIIVMNHHRLFFHIRESIRGAEINIVPCLINENIKNYTKSRILLDRLLSKFRKTIYKLLPNQALSYYSMWRLRKKIKMKEKEYLKNKTPLDEIPESIILQYEKDLNSFIDYLKEKKIVPVMPTFPFLTTLANKDIYKTILMETRLMFFIEFSEDGILDAMCKLNTLIKKTAEKQDVVCIDIDNLLPKTLEYFADELHYTDKGAELIAKEICESLIRSNFCGRIKPVLSNS